jgi:hypothetical protein
MMVMLHEKNSDNTVGAKSQFVTPTIDDEKKQLLLEIKKQAQAKLPKSPAYKGIYNEAYAGFSPYQTPLFGKIRKEKTCINTPKKSDDLHHDAKQELSEQYSYSPYATPTSHH